MRPVVPLYRYELRRDDELVATGRLSAETAIEVGDRIRLAGQEGVVVAVEPLLGGAEARLVVVSPPGR